MSGRLKARSEIIFNVGARRRIVNGVPADVHYTKLTACLSVCLSVCRIGRVLLSSSPLLSPSPSLSLRAHSTNKRTRPSWSADDVHGQPGQDRGPGPERFLHVRGVRRRRGRGRLRRPRGPRHETQNERPVRGTWYLPASVCRAARQEPGRARDPLDLRDICCLRSVR